MEPHTVRPRRFDQAQEVADKFKDGQPVIMNLEGTEREVARRLIDFASGICYALDGSMEKVATGVYLLKPPAAASASATTTTTTDDTEQAMDMTPATRQERRVQDGPQGSRPRRGQCLPDDVADELERAQNQSTAMEARARAAVARLQEVSDAEAAAQRPTVDAVGRRGRDDQPHPAARAAHRRHRRCRGRGEAARIVSAANDEAATTLDSTREMSAQLLAEARAEARQRRRGRRVAIAERGRGAQGPPRLPRVRRRPARVVPRRSAQPASRRGHRHRSTSPNVFPAASARYRRRCCRHPMTTPATPQARRRRSPRRRRSARVAGGDDDRR